MSRRCVATPLVPVLAELGRPVGSVPFETGHVQGAVAAMRRKVRTVVMRPRRHRVESGDMMSGPVGHRGAVMTTTLSHHRTVLADEGTMRGHRGAVRSPAARHAMLGVSLLVAMAVISPGKPGFGMTCEPEPLSCAAKVSTAGKRPFAMEGRTAKQGSTFMSAKRHAGTVAAMRALGECTSRAAMSHRRASRAACPLAHRSSDA